MSELTFEILKNLYEEDLLTDAEIADKFNIKQASVSRIRKRWGIETLDKTGRLAKKLPELTPVQKELIIGSLLGDGHAGVSSKSSAFISEGHSEAQADYTRWKAGLLGEYVSCTYPGVKRVKGKEYKSLSYKTHSCPQLLPFYDLFYPLGKRIFPRTLPELMTPFVLAIWYLDDGSLTNAYTPRISFGLDEVSLERSLAALYQLGLNPTIHQNPNRNDLDLFFNKGNAERFRQLVLPYIPECMSYKIPQESPRIEELENAKGVTQERVQKARDSGMSMSEMSLKFGVTKGTVRRRSEGVEQVMLPGKITPDLTAERLRSLYLQFSDDEIGGQYQTSGNSIAYWRKKYNIPTMDIHEKRDALGLPSILHLDEDTLRTLYQSQGDRSIAERYGTTKPVIAKLRQKWGIESLSKTERANTFPKRPFTPAPKPAPSPSIAPPSPVVPLPTPPSPKLVCQDCGSSDIESPRKGFCEICRKKREATQAREKRAQERQVNPVKETRTFTCTVCKQEWETTLKGSFKYCPSCKEKKGQDPRSKLCQYRNCQISFLDTSKKNSLKFCCEEHRRREKLFRVGKATDESYFQYQDTPGAEDKTPKRKRTCIKCKSVFYLRPEDPRNKNICLECRPSPPQPLTPPSDLPKSI